MFLGHLISKRFHILIL